MEQTRAAVLPFPGPPSWERLPGESARSYAAFCLYRDLGPRRSLAAAAERFYCGATAAKLRQVETWSAAHGWVGRAEAYDAAQERSAREGREAESRSELEAYRERQRRLAIQTFQGTIRLLEKANARLEALQAGDIPVESLPRFFLAAVAEAEAATNAEAQAIAVAELLALLSRPGTP